MSVLQVVVRGSRPVALALGFCAGALAAGPVLAGGIMLYEIGTADTGLASAGYGARAQDASTVFTNPAGMTRLEGTQTLVAGQVLWSSLKFSVDAGTSPALGGDNGGRAVGWDGWFGGGGAFLSHTVTPDLKVGFAIASNFGSALDYGDNWVGRYYVQKTALIGLSLLPSVAYKVTDQLSVGASLNAMYGYYKNQVAINNVLPGYPDGQLKLDDDDWGFGVNLGLLYDLSPGTRIGVTWNSQVNLDFQSPAEFSGLAPGVATVFANRGLLFSQIKVGIKVPQQAMASLYTELDDKWALLAGAGWQQWSKFGQVTLGVDDATNPRGLETNLDFDDTWHLALGAQYRYSDAWLLNFGVAYDSSLQSGSQVSPVLPVAWAWRFGAGAQQQLTKTAFWGVAAEYIYGGTMDVALQGRAPALGGRGDVIGSFNNTGTIVVSGYYNWQF